jgi:hypothetical protein
MTDRTAWLVIGGLHHLNGSARPAPSDPLVLVPFERPLDAWFPSNTIVPRWSELGALELRGRTADGGVRALGKADGAELFDGMLPGAALAGVLAQLSTVDTVRTGVVPLFYLSARPAGAGVDGVDVHVYSQIRFLAEDACFVRTTPEPIRVRQPAGVEQLGWLPAAVRRHAEQFLLLNNHQRYYRKCFPGRELEYKYTLAPPVDIWTMTVRLYQRLLRGELPGYLMEYRDEFQAWDYTNHLFQVTGPEDGRGYVSFIPTTDGKNLLKRKWFDADAFDRRESHTYGVRPPHGFASYVRDVLGVTARRLPPFRRVRYDVNFESARSGHVYGIFFDHVSLLDAPDVTLHQCELEYLRSRTAVEPDEELALAELAHIATWLEAYLREQGLDDRRGTYSKMTFLLDAVAANPALAEEYP